MRNPFRIAIVASILLSLVVSATGQQSEIASRIEAILSQNANYEFDDQEEWQADMLTAMQAVYGNAKASRETEELILSFLESDATFAAKKAIWLEYSNIATKESVPRLFALLERGDATSPLAFYTLSRARLIDKQTLSSRFKGLSPENQVSLLNYYGDNQDDSGFALAKDALDSSNSTVSKAAFLTLGKIGTVKAAKLLQAQLSHDASSLDFDKLDALLQCADRLSKTGHAKQARALYETLMDSDTPATIRSAALTGLFELSDRSSKFIEARIDTVDAELRPRLIHLARDLPPTFKKGIQLLDNDNLSNSDKAQLLLLLATRKDPSIHDFTLEQIESGEGPLREAALIALPSVAQSSDLDFLLAHADKASSKAEKERFLKTLASIRGNEVDEQLFKRMANSTEDQLSILLEVARLRATPKITEQLFAFTASENRGVRREAFKTLESLGNKDDLPRALNSLFAATSSSDRRAWERTVFRLAQKSPEDTHRSDAIVKALASEPSAENQASLLLVLGELGNPQDFELLQSYLRSNDSGIQLKTIEALGKWPNSDPAPDLLAIYRNSNDPKQRTAALQGLIKLTLQERALTYMQQLERFDSFLEETQSASDEKLLIAAYGEIDRFESLERLVALLESSPLKREIQSSIRSIARRVYSRDNDSVKALMLKAREYSTDDAFRQWIDEGLRDKRFSR